MRSGHVGTVIAPVVCAGVGVRYGTIRAIRLASFRLAPSGLGIAALGIVATQPAARTTLLDLLSGRIAPAYGKLAVLGHDMRTARGRAAARHQVGLASQSSKILPAIRVRGLVERAA